MSGGASQRVGDERGVTLLESLLATAILGIAMVGVVPSLFVQMDANTRNEQRTGALAAAQRTVEELRQQDPGTLPSGGSTVTQVVVGGRIYDVRTRYCKNATYCTSASRHIVTEVTLDGQPLYDVESVLTRLR